MIIGISASTARGPRFQRVASAMTMIRTKTAVIVARAMPKARATWPIT